MQSERELASSAKAWPFQEARALIERLGGAGGAHTPDKGHVLFETGYGPSGLPHIGPFREVPRPPMVRPPFATLSAIPPPLAHFRSDDLRVGKERVCTCTSWWTRDP